MKKKNTGNYNRFLLLWAGQLVSAIGNGLTSFGLGVYVFHQTKSAADMAFVTLFAFLPTLLLGIPAGVLADRYDRRLLMMLGDGCSALGLVFILFCIRRGGADLTQICLGVTVSSVFSSLLEPSYRATVTDLLDEEEYSRAGGMVSLAGSAKYLISPLLAGALLAVSDIQLLLVIDICTFFLTVISTGAVRKGLTAKEKEPEVKEPFSASVREGWKAVTEKKGLVILLFLGAVMTCFMGTFQILSKPLILDLGIGTANLTQGALSTDSAVLGFCESLCALGMLLSSLFLGIRGIRKGYVRILCASLFLAGICMIFFGLEEKLFLICAAGLLFFATLPFANNCLDYLVRTNIARKLQGRAWGLIGFVSQTGYVAAYGLSGFLADAVGRLLKTGVGRGAAAVIMGAGGLLMILALVLYAQRSVRELEKKAAYENS